MRSCTRDASTLVVFFGLALGCSKAPSIEQLGEANAPIILGSTVDNPVDTQDDFEASVRLIFTPLGQTSGSLCTGTLVSCRDVLTAQHCWDELGEPHQRVAVQFKEYRGGAEPVTRTVEIDPLQENVNFKPRRGVRGYAGDDDMLLLKLPVPITGVRPATAFRGTHADIEAMILKQRFALAGYGFSSTFENRCGEQDNQRHFGTTFVTSVDFLHPGIASLIYTRSQSPNGNLDSVPVGGDSGSGLLIDDGMRLSIVGTSVQDSLNCPPTSAAWTYVPDHLAWFDSFVTPGADSDADGVPDECDNCPVWNPTQLDTDADGKGDACDIDNDDDGVADSRDNCLGLKNPNQENCNRDAELALGQTQRGDACDDSPCATSRTGTRALGLPFGPSCRFGTPCPVTVNSSIQWRGVVSGDDEGKDGKVSFAHCTCDKLHSTAEQRVANCQIAGGAPRCSLGRSDQFPVGASVPSAWRAITTLQPQALPPPRPPGTQLVPIKDIDYGSLFGSIRTPFGAPTGTLGAEHATARFSPGGGATHSTAWLFESDLAAFGLSFTRPAGGVQSPQQISALTTALNGIGWAFTTSIGGQLLRNGPSQRANLSSAYFAQDLAPQFTSPPLDGPIFRFPLWWSGCAACRRDALTWLVRPPSYDAALGELLAVSEGSIVKVKPAFDQSVRDLVAALGDDLRFLPAAEADNVLVGNRLSDRGVFVNTSTGRVAILRELASGTLSAVELAAPALVGANPSALTYSARSGELLAIKGGSSAQLVAVDTHVNSVTTTSLGDLGSPVGLAFLPEDRQLYLASRVGADQLKLARLARDGSSQSLGTATTSSFRRNVQLTNTSSGRLLLSAFGEAYDKPLHLMVEARGAQAKIIAGYFDDRAGVVPAAPAALDPYGITLRRRRSDGSSHVSELREDQFFTVADLDLSQVTDLLATRDALDSCSKPLASANSCASLREVALFASRELTVRDRSKVLTSSGFGAVGQAGTSTLTVGNDAQIGSILSSGSVSVGDRAEVHGFVRSQGNVTRGAGSSVSGPSLSGATVLLQNLSNFNVAFPTSTLGDVRLEPNQVQSLTQGPYETLSVKSGATVFLPAGTYSFDTLELEPGGHLSTDRLAGPVYIYVRLRLALKGSIDAGSGPSSDLFIGYFGSDTAFVETSFTGTIAAPVAKLVLGGSSHRGSFFARDLEVYPDVSVRLLPFPYPWVL